MLQQLLASSANPGVTLALQAAAAGLGHGDGQWRFLDFTIDEARPYWDHAIAHAPRGLLRKLDIYLLAAWCNAAHRYEYIMRLAARSDVIPVRGAKLAGLDLKDRPVMHNPFSTAARSYLKDMTMLAAELGFTPSSRARLGAAEMAAPSVDDPWEQIAE